jgi:amicyanin
MKPRNHLTLGILAAGVALSSGTAWEAVNAGTQGHSRAGYGYGYGPMPPPYRPYLPMRRPPFHHPMPPMRGPAQGYLPPQAPPQWPAELAATPAPAAAPAASAAMAADDAPASGDVAVRIAQMQFSPAQITVKRGATVTWTQMGSIPHTVTARDGSFDSKTLGASASYSETFEEPGTYDYFCSLHPTMQGQIVVVD